VIFRRKKPSRVRLLLYAEGGGRLERPLDAALLQGLLEKALSPGDASLRLSWERHGLLGTRALAPLWPDHLTPPAGIFLRSQHALRRERILEVDLPDCDLEEYADDVVRFLSGRKPLPRRDARPAARTGDAGSPPPPGQAVDLVVDGEEASTVGGRASARSAEVLPPEPAPKREEASRTRRRPPEDLFALAGPLHPEDFHGDHLAIHWQDLEWLNPGDSIRSSRRGPCRVLKVEGGSRGVLVRDARNRKLRILAEELIREFQFDEEPAR